MGRYNTFLILFLASVLVTAVFMVFYLQAIFSVVAEATRHVPEPDPFEMLSTIFSPQVLFSGIVMALTGLAYRILGIVYTVRNKTVSDGEKALWIIGFILMGFVTSIVFLVLGRKRGFME